ncbi:MAG: metallophosphoesterase [Phycisphaerales bacterium]|nr:MAG: metallophosphoesterase [Phycisphaerales bacterium]
MDSQPARNNWMMTRRVFLGASASCLTSLAAGPLVSDTFAGSRPNTARFGIVTDSHYTNRNYSNRFCNESLEKMSECVELMNKQEVDFLVELGDFKDQDDPPVEENTISYLQAVEGVFQQFTGSIYHVLGNHDMDSISKSQFLANVENTRIAPGASYYSFGLNGLHFVILDANYISNGTDYDHGNFSWTDANIPPAELDWLRQDLASVEAPVIVFIHQLLDGTGSHYVKNAANVRQILEASGKVLAVFQGHNHPGAYSQIGGIHYYTLKALVEGSGAENNAYAIVEVHPDRSMTVSAYRKAIRREFAARCSIADLNGDCIVDFRDYSLMAEKWLDAGLAESDGPPGRRRR